MINNKKETDNLTQQLLHYKTEGKPLKYLVNYMYSLDYSIKDVIEKMEVIGYDKKVTAECFVKDFGIVSALNYDVVNIVDPAKDGRLKINCVPVVITYNYDIEASVILFASREDAIKYIEKDFEDEKRISVEENGYEIDETETYFDKKMEYAILTVSKNIVTEWRIGNIY